MTHTHHRLNVLLLVAALAVFLPTWLWLGEAWWSDPYYSHGPLVLLIALYLAWTQRHVTPALHPTQCGASVATQPTVISRAGSAREISNSLQREISHLQKSQVRNDILTSNNLGWALIVPALAIHLWASLWRAYYISALMIPLALFGLIVTLYGWRIARRFLFPLAFLVLMVPLPLAERFGPMLEGWTATSATALAQLVGVAARNDGSQVFLPNSTFTVGIPCGGLRSAIAIITLATLLAHIVQGGAGRRIAVFFAAIPIALAANTLRISLLFAIANAWGTDAAMNYFHDWSSPVLFMCAFALLLALVKLLRCSSVRWEAVLPE